MERRHYCTVQGRAISIVLSINAYASMLQGCAKMEALPEGYVQNGIFA